MFVRLIITTHLRTVECGRAPSNLSPSVPACASSLPSLSPYAMAPVRAVQATLGKLTHCFGMDVLPLDIPLGRFPPLITRILLKCHTKLRIRLSRVGEYRGCGILGRRRGHEPSRLPVLIQVRHLMIVGTGQGVLRRRGHSVGLHVRVGLEEGALFPAAVMPRLHSLVNTMSGGGRR